MRTLKGIFFRILFEFKTLSFEKVLELAQVVYNHRKHRSLYGKTPQEVHFDSHTSSEICKKLIARTQERQTRLTNIFSLKKKQVYHVGDRVLLKRKRATFYKQDLTKHNMFETEVRKITQVDKSCLPYLYSITGSDKKYYFFELKKVGAEYGSLESSVQSTETSKIFVEDFNFEQLPLLRSGRIIANRNPIVYTIRRGEKTETVSAQHLKFFKKFLGKQVLTYSEKFKQHPEYII